MFNTFIGILQNKDSTREIHASKYPINCDPIDGISPNLHAMQTRTTSCQRCLQGESVSIYPD